MVPVLDKGMDMVAADIACTVVVETVVDQTQVDMAQGNSPVLHNLPSMVHRMEKLQQKVILHETQRDAHMH
jgi:hypothetical protein